MAKKEEKRWSYIIRLLNDYPHENCAEIGIWRGTFTLNLLRGLPNIKQYHCVDLWKHYEDHVETLNPKGKMAKSDMDQVYREFTQKAKHFKDKIVIYRMTSVEAAKIIKDDSLDFLFIDANHAYEYAKEDIEIWTPKVKIGGIISGHDYGNKRFGVTQAVHESFDNFELGSNHVWWTIK